MTTTTKPTMYENLKAHLAKHMFKRGKHKGDAPADASARAKSHFRVSTRNGGMAVVFHATDIITAYPDGTITLHMGGYEDSPTTKAAYRHAMGTFGTFTSYLHSTTQFGLSQTCVTTYRPIAGQKTYRYTSHMRFDAEGNLLTDPVPFQRRGIDKDKSKEFIQAIKDSNFTIMFPLLFTTAEKPNRTELMNTRIPDAETLRFYLTNPDKARFWHTIVGRYKYYGYRASAINIGDERTRAECWTAIMVDAKRDMYKITDTDVTNI
jgi:hypothetical protein